MSFAKLDTGEIQLNKDIDRATHQAKIISLVSDTADDALWL